MKPVIVITGCSSGIGRAAAVLFASKGWQVVATMRQPEAHPLPDTIAVMAMDVTQPSQIAAVIAETLQRFGRIDALVNNAGFGAFGPMETASEALLERQWQTNVQGVMATIRAVLPAMRAQQQGVIVNIASIGGLVTMPLNAVYHATKYAVVGLSEGLHYELAPWGIQSKIVAPGGVATDFAGRSLSLTYQGDDHPYHEYVTQVQQAFSQRQGHYSTPEAVADVIYTAVTDGERQRVRYVVGADAQALLAAREQLGEAGYLHMMQQRFAPQPAEQA